MKKCILFLSFLVAMCSSSTREARRACIFDNGLNNSTDVKRLLELLKFNSAERDVEFEDKVACAIACGFHVAKRRHVTLYGDLGEAIDSDDKLDEAVKTDMKETLIACHAKDGDDDCTMLKCVKILQQPFLGMIVKAREILLNLPLY